jgi:hypothetical protein
MVEGVQTPRPLERHSEIELFVIVVAVVVEFPGSYSPEVGAQLPVMYLVRV